MSSVDIKETLYSLRVDFISNNCAVIDKLCVVCAFLQTNWTQDGVSRAIEAGLLETIVMCNSRSMWQGRTLPDMLKEKLIAAVALQPLVQVHGQVSRAIVARMCNDRQHKIECEKEQLCPEVGNTIRALIREAVTAMHKTHS